MPVKDNNFDGSSILGFREWWHHMQPENSMQQAISTMYDIIQSRLLYQKQSQVAQFSSVTEH